MPTFEFTSPEGKRYAVTGPDGATQEQAFAILQGQISSGTAQAANPQTDGVPNAYGQNAPAPSAPAPARSLGDKVEGGIETALALGTGATGGTLGMIGGTVKGLAGAVMDGTFGTQQGVQQVEQSAADGMAAFTYAPRGEAGQELTGAIGEKLAATIPLAGFGAEMGAVGRGASAAAGAARDMTVGTRSAAVAGAKTAATQARKASAQIAERVQRTLSRNPEPEGRRAGGSVGAAGVEEANMRRTIAESFPVPLDLTEGMATRDFMQQHFEKETAKMEGGGKLRDRASELNEKVPQNFEAWIDESGAAAYGASAVGESVAGTLTKLAKQDKAKVRSAYKTAERSDEASFNVNPDEVIELPHGDEAITASLISYLNDKPTGLKTTSVTDHAKQYAVRLGIAEMGDDGKLLPKTATVKTMEDLRREIGQATGIEAYERRDAAILKGIIDAQTEPVAGPLYKKARQLRTELARKYEDREMVANLINNKRNMADRKVAIEDVFQNTVLKGSAESRTHLRDVLTKPDADTPPALREAGEQAWKDLQGALIQHLKDDSLKGVSSDHRSKPIFSADRLNTNVRLLDQDGTLDIMLGKKRAADVREMNEIVKLINTAPPGSFNTSGTTATLLAALGEAGANGAMFGLPVPVLTTLRFLAKQHKNIKLQKRIDAALVRRPRAQQPPQF